MKRNTLILGLAACVAAQVLAQTVAPYVEVPTNSVPTNAVVYEWTPPPAPGAPPAVPNSPSVSTNFQGLDDNSTVIPPDTMGAVGPSHIMTMLNTQVRIQNRAGTTNYSTVTLSSWWSNVATNVFDPRVVYDAHVGRWIASAAADARSASSSVLLAVSQTSDPTGAWYFKRFDADPNNTTWADFPTLGFNTNWIVVQVTMYTNTNDRFYRSQIYAFDKTNIYAGGTNYTLFALDPSYGATQFPATTYDRNETSLYLVQTWASGFLRLYSIQGNPASPTLSAPNIFIQGQPWAHTPGNIDFGPQSNTTVKVHLGDSRIRSVCLRNGSVWCAQTIFLPDTAPTRSAVQWWELATYSAALQVGRIDDAANVKFYAYPSIAVNAFDDVLVGYSRFSTNQYVSANYSFRASTNAQNTLQTEQVLKAGEGRYYKTFGSGQNRWGDYSATMVDPVNDADLWTIQEYAATPASTGLNDGDGRWGTWWGQVTVELPANDYFTNAFVISGFAGTTNGSNFRATKEPGEPSYFSTFVNRSIWYSWTAPTNTSVTIDTIGSDFDTYLSIYTGSVLTNLAYVTDDDNSGGGVASRVVFTPSAGTTYYVIVEGVSASRGSVVLNWNQPSAPMFTTQPHGLTNYVGDSITFSAVAIGAPLPTYQWQFNGANISGATNASYTIANVTTNDAGSYRVIASNSSGSVTSLVATLTVLTTQGTLAASMYTTNNTFKFTVARETNYHYIIQANTNLNTSNWVSLATNTAPFIFTDTNATNFPYRFYRAIYKP